ncbi:MAG TPA: putative sugar O-methyltransferase [Vicinamibacterales bacterium]|jgi:glycosyltransferase involved in cell wall biosynthesis|nr:putative sugar O-methyltransferase [Vicinamibacterales bacterium]
MTPVDPRTAPGYDAFLRARDAVLRMKQGESAPAGSAVDPSTYWSEELENIDYLIEASPLIVRKLRHHAFHITGIRPYDYRSKGDGRREHFEQRLQALRALGGDALAVPESPALGGFGYDVGGRLFNVDTIKFYEVLIGMERGGVLPALRGVDRPVVCEVGSGWGGFAYQFKTLFPRTTYVLVDFAELFLFSATYLGTVFPDASLLFVDPAAAEPLAGWRDADFVLVPHTAASLVSQLPLDLTVNMVSFQEMTAAQVRGYAALAATAGCPLLYSLNRERSPYNTELVSVTQELAEHYRLTEVPVLETDYTSAMKKPPKATRMVERNELGYRHVVGRLDASARPGDSAARAAVGVVLGMTLYNNAANLPEAIESLLAQTWTRFTLVLLDDASSDGTEAVARAYAAADSRVRYVRHDRRRAMIATWHEAAELAVQADPSAVYFAWVSDHDRWHPRWLARLVGELETDAGAVLAYPITRRMGQAGQELEKGPRLFDTRGVDDVQERWRRFCHDGVGSGDMVYGLMRVDALRRAGIFRRVLRPDRLLMTELTLQGRVLQVPEVLWFRRQSMGTSVERQHRSLVLEGDEPRWFAWPPWFQHTLVLWQEYAVREPRPLPISRGRWARMLVRFQLTYGWRHFRKTSASHAVGRGIDHVVFAKKRLKHHYHHAVYHTLVGARAGWGKARRVARRVVYEGLVLTHRLGLRGSRETR